MYLSNGPHIQSGVSARDSDALRCARSSLGVSAASGLGAYDPHLESVRYNAVQCNRAAQTRNTWRGEKTRLSKTFPRVLLATGSYIGEGFDDPQLDTLLLAMPVSWKGTLQQYVGRLHRLHENKSEVRVYDYADVQVPMLARMFKKRLAGYAALGYTLDERPQP